MVEVKGKARGERKGNYGLVDAKRGKRGVEVDEKAGYDD